MQVDRYNHLLFPRDATAGAGNTTTNNDPAANGNKGAASGAAGRAAAPQARPQQPGWGAQADGRAATRTESVVLKIQWPDGSGAKPKDIPLYTPGGRMPVTGGGATPMAASPDGALVVSKPAQPEEAPQETLHEVQPDFVSLAVSALREYRDDRERQTAVAASPAAAPEAPWTALKGLQQFAAKLNVFA